MKIMRSIRKLENKFDLKTERFVWKHPFLGFLLIFIGLPAFILICVSICTTVITFPLACLFGWL